MALHVEHTGSVTSPPKICDKLQSDPADWVPLCSHDVLEATLGQNFQFTSEECALWFLGTCVQGLLEEHPPDLKCKL